MKEVSFDGEDFHERKALWQKEHLGNHEGVKTPTVRTFRADVQELIQEKKTTKTDVLLAEAKKREMRGEERFPTEEDSIGLGKWIFVLSLVFAFGLGVGLYALVGFQLPFFSGQQATSTPLSTPEDTLINIENSPREQVLADISLTFGRTALPSGASRKINFIKGDDRPATTKELFHSIVSTPYPKNFFDTFNQDIDYRIYSASNLTGVLLVKFDSYATTFSTLFDSEKILAENLVLLFNPWYQRKNIPLLRKISFKDFRVENLDLRVLIDHDQREVLAYTFIDKKYLIMGGNQEAILMAINQLMTDK